MNVRHSILKTIAVARSIVVARPTFSSQPVIP
jgi:hypothetical protein